MSAASARNWATMLKEKKTVTPKTAAAPVMAPQQPPPVPAVPEQPAPEAVSEAPAAVTTPFPRTPEPAPVAAIPAPAAAEEPVKAPAMDYASFGPVAVPERLATLVKLNAFRFAGTSAPPKVEECGPLKATVLPPVSVPMPAAVTSPIAPAPVSVSATTVSSSSEVARPPPPPQQQQWTAPQPVCNPPMSHFVPQQEGPQPYGGELGSVPRYYNAERRFHMEHQHQVEPYHPSYPTPYYGRGGYCGNSYGNMYDGGYSSYYPGQGAQYMGSRLQANAPYYPPREPQQYYQQSQYFSQQQQRPAAM